MTLAKQLLALETAELIRLATSAPDLQYLFRHALVQETAYRSLVRADRRRLHLAAGECLERIVPDALASPEVAALLAWHFDRADDARTLAYAQASAEAAMGRYANTEAVSFYDVALRWAHRSPDGAALAGLYAARGRALELSGQFEEAFANYAQLAAAGAERQQPALRLRALVLQGQLRSTANPLFDLAEGERLAAEGLTMAQAFGDWAAEAKIHWNRLNLLRFAGDNAGARASGEISLKLARKHNLPDQIALTLNDLIHVYGALNVWPEHQAAATEASQRWRDMGNLPMLADSLATGAMYAAITGKLETGRQWAAEAYEISRRINNAWGQAYSLAHLSHAAWYRADYGEALRLAEECLRQAEAAGYIVALALNRTELALVLADVGLWNRAEQEARLALAWAQARIPIFTPLAQATLAELQSGAGNIEAAAQALAVIDPNSVPNVFWVADPIRRVRVDLALAERSGAALSMARARLDDLRAKGLQLFVPEAQVAVARAYRQAGNVSEARREFTNALAGAEALGLRRAIWPIQRELAQVEAALGNTEAADRLNRAASELIDEISAALPSDTLRESFQRRAAST